MLFDLSVLIDEQTPVWDGDPKVKVAPYETFEKNDCEDKLITFGNHIGTHIDAPSHMIKNAKSLDKFSPDKFTGRGVCIKVDGNFNLSEIKRAEIKEGDIIFFYTGMGEKFYQPAYFQNYPIMGEEIANFLVEKGVKIVGLDTASIDDLTFENHRILLSKDILIIENLANLGQLIGKEFRVYAFPLKLDLDGAPVRVIAEVLE